MASILTKQDVVRLLRANQATLQGLGVKRLGLFGSFVRNTQGPDSDIDLLVEFDPTRKTYRNFMGLVSLLETLAARRVEIVTPESHSSYIGPHILAEVEYVAFGN